MDELKKKYDAAMETFQEEWPKVMKGNKAAGTRARKALHEMRSLAMDLRKAISAAK